MSEQNENPCDFIRDGICEYAIVKPKNSTAITNDAVKVLCDLISGYCSDNEQPKVIFDDGEIFEKEILVGNTSRPETAYIRKELEYTEYSVSTINKKIVLCGLGEDTTAAAVMRFADYCKSFVPRSFEGKVNISADLKIKEKYSHFKYTVPAYVGGTVESVSEGNGNNSYVVIIKDTTEKEYKKYLAQLSSNNYSKYTENEIHGNLFSVYTNEKTTVYISYYPCYSTIRIALDPGKTVFGLIYDNVYEDRKRKNLLTQVKLEFASDTCGMSYVIRLCDGSFLVIDGGLDEYSVDTKDAEHDRLFNLLRTQTPKDEKIVIAAWILTHAHNDHVECFCGFAKRYSGEVEVEKVILNMPCTSQWKNRFDIEEIERSIEYLRARKIIAHTGQILHIRDAEIEMLYTLDDFYPECVRVDFNESSLAFSLKIAGQKYMFLGDAGVRACKIIGDMYGESLKSDVLQISHHGWRGGSVRVYDYVSPEYCFFPAATDVFIERSKLSLTSFLVNNKKIKELIVSGEKTRILELPYNPKS